MSDEPENCPHCKVSLLGEPIPKEDAEFYSGTHFKREIGVEVQGKYDGVWYFMCPDCDGEFGGARDWRNDPNCLVGKDE